MLDTWLQDAKYTWRQARRSPGFTVAVVAVMALGIGANAAMFTVLRGTVLRKLPYRYADRLVVLGALDPTRTPANTVIPDIEAWRQRGHTLQSIAYYSAATAYVRQGNNDLKVGKEQISANLMETLGAEPALGRTFREEEQQPGKDGEVILSDAIWQSQFQRDSGVLGRTVMVNGTPLVVVGVMPKGFQFPSNADPAQIWVPVPLSEKTKVRDWQAGTFDTIARRKPDASVNDVGRELSALQRELSKLYTERAEELKPVQVKAADYRSGLMGEERESLCALTAAVGMVWLIACANVANLMLARSAARSRETAVRGALGASITRLIRQSLIESLLLSAAGGAMGILLAVATLRVFQHELSLQFAGQIPIWPDSTVIAALLVLTLLSVLLFGLIPAMLSAHSPIEAAMRQGGAGAGHGRRQQRIQRLLVVGEIGLTLTMLISCGLLLKTVLALRKVPLGFRTENVYVITPDLPGYKYTSIDPNMTVYKPLVERLRQMHGVESAAVTTLAPLDVGFDAKMTLWLQGADGQTIQNKINASMRASGPDLQKALGFQMARGRFFNESDTATTQPVAVVNKEFAKQYETGSGKKISDFWLRMGKDRKFQIVGIVDDFHQKGIGVAPVPEVDFNAAQMVPSDGFYNSTLKEHAEIIVRSTLSSAVFMPDLLRTMREVSPDLGAAKVKPMQQIVEDSMGSQLLAAHLLEALGVLALIVALTGLYGLLAYLVTLQTREMGLRIALGAQREQVLGLVMKQAGWMLGGGVLLGVMLSLAVSQLMSRFLFGVEARDLMTFMIAALLLLTVGGIAAFLPARRASRIEPMQALRTE